MLLFKITGLIILFFVCVVFGFAKANIIRKRAKLLEEIHRSLSVLAEYIRANGGELSAILPLSFNYDFISIKENKISFKKEFLENADIDLLTEFFNGLGLGDKKREYERTKLFTELVKKQSEEAREKADNLCKLYNTIGILSGAFVCLFFL